MVQRGQLQPNRLQPVPADLDGHDLQGLIVASPGNPSGTMLSRTLPMVRSTLKIGITNPTWMFGDFMLMPLIRGTGRSG